MNLLRFSFIFWNIKSPSSYDYIMEKFKTFIGDESIISVKNSQIYEKYSIFGQANEKQLCVINYIEKYHIESNEDNIDLCVRLYKECIGDVKLISNIETTIGLHRVLENILIEYKNNSRKMKLMALEPDKVICSMPVGH